MTINRKRDTIHVDDFMAVAGRQGIEAADAREAIVRVSEAVSHWGEYAQRAGVGDQQSEKIGGLNSHIREHGTSQSQPIY